MMVYIPEVMMLDYSPKHRQWHRSMARLFTADQKRLLLIVVAGVALACVLAWLSSLIWPPPHPFWV